MKYSGKNEDDFFIAITCFKINIVTCIMHSLVNLLIGLELGFYYVEVSGGVLGWSPGILK